MGAIFIMTSKIYIPDLGVFSSYIVLTNNQVRKTIFSPEKIIKYLDEPEQLMINTKKAIKEALPTEEVSERWSEYFPSNDGWGLNWMDDYSDLMTNYVDGNKFNTFRRLERQTNDSESVTSHFKDVIKRTSVDRNLIDKWCSHQEWAMIEAGNYEWGDQSQVRMMGQHPDISKKLMIKQCQGKSICIGLGNRSRLVEALPYIVLPYLFSLFWSLEEQSFSKLGAWGKQVVVERCQKPECDKIYAKYITKGKTRVYCSTECGSAERQKRFRARQLNNGRMVASA